MNWRRLSDPLNWFRPVKADAEVLSLAKRRLASAKLKRLAALQDASVSEFLLDAVMKTIDAKHDMIGTLETKASAQIGFAGAIMAIVVALERSQLVWLAALLLGVSILANLRAMLVTEYRAPSPLMYNLDAVLADPGNKARIAATLTEAYGRYGMDLGVEAGKKSRYVLAGTLFLVFGVAVVVTSAFLPAQTGELKLSCPTTRCNVIVQGTDSNGSGSRRLNRPAGQLRKHSGSGTSTR